MTLGGEHLSTHDLPGLSGQFEVALGGVSLDVRVDPGLELPKVWVPSGASMGYSHRGKKLSLSNGRSREPHLATIDIPPEGFEYLEEFSVSGLAESIHFRRSEIPFGRFDGYGLGMSIDAPGSIVNLEQIRARGMSVNANVLAASGVKAGSIAGNVGRCVFDGCELADRSGLKVASAEPVRPFITMRHPDIPPPIPPTRRRGSP